MIILGPIRQKTGIFGGTFNPIHYGHLLIAECARAQFGLDRVIFIPTGQSPHKEYMGADMSQHRCEMTRLAIQGNPFFEISEYEIHNTGINYTWQTLKNFEQEYPGNELYFILGADSLFDFSGWRHPERIAKEAVILAAVRGVYDTAAVDEQIRCLSGLYEGDFRRIDSPGFDLSSQNIRTRIAAQAPVRYMVPEAVEAYIREHHLYKL